MTNGNGFISYLILVLVARKIIHHVFTTDSKFYYDFYLPPLPVHVAVNRWTTLATDAWTVAVKKGEGERRQRRRSTFKLSPPPPRCRCHRTGWKIGRAFSPFPQKFIPCFCSVITAAEIGFFAMNLGAYVWNLQRYVTILMGIILSCWPHAPSCWSNEGICAVNRKDRV